ncbi:MAG: twin-arginine translocase TatA/TatE family subunit [Bdellovibrionota bacterium]
MFGISFEHLIVIGIVLLIFGPRRLPELGNTLGKAIRNFKDAIGGVEEAKFRRIEPGNPQQAAATKTEGAATQADATSKATDVPQNPV